MIEILKNIKALIFSYMSIIFVLFLVVFQSNQDVYNSAISQLRQIELLLLNYDEELIHQIIANKIGNADRERSVFLLSDIDVVIEFLQMSHYFDYGALEGKFELNEFPGFDFRDVTLDRLPVDFTEVTSVKTSLFVSAPARDISSYQKIHSQTLEDVDIPFLTPDFSTARIEAYQFKVERHNSIEIVNSSEYHGHQVFDSLSLSSIEKQNDLTCELQLVKTVTNDKYAFICHIGAFDVDDIEYSGARLLLQAKSDYISLDNKELTNAYSIPVEKRIVFEKAYKELYEIARAYSDLEFTEVEDILELQKDRSPNKLSIFGTEISVPTLTKWAFPILIIMCLYMYLHLHEAIQRVKISEDSKIDVPWIGIYADVKNKYAVFVQLIVFPVILMALIHIRSKRDSELVLAWMFCAVLLVINCRNYILVGRLRKTLLDKEDTNHA